MLQTCIKNRLIRRGIVALALLAVLLGIPVEAAQTFDEAVVAYERRDYATAIRGFLVHAEQGTAEAQLNLGLMYALGQGVLKDEAEAARWFRLAAEQGNAAAAQFNLGVMYANGERVLKDSVLAHMWCNIAGANGHEAAREGRDHLERDMTRAEDQPRDWTGTGVHGLGLPGLRAVSRAGITPCGGLSSLPSPCWTRIRCSSCPQASHRTQDFTLQETSAGAPYSTVSSLSVLKYLTGTREDAKKGPAPVSPLGWEHINLDWAITSGLRASKLNRAASGSCRLLNGP